MTALYIRYDESDTGSRPVPGGLPDGTTWWLSPDVRICRNNAATDRAVVGQQHQIRVFVHSAANVPVTNARIEVWPCRFGTAPQPIGSFPPTAFDRRSCRVTSLTAGGDPCAAAGGAVINPCSIPAASGAPQIVFFETNWTPLQQDIDDLTGAPGNTEGHLCLIANCYGDTPDHGAALARNAAGGIVGHNVPGNEHHAQRNITVAAATPGIKQIKFWAGNFLDKRGGERFVIETDPVRELPGRLERLDLAQNEWFKRLGGLRSLSTRVVDRALELQPSFGPFDRPPKVELENGVGKGRKIKLAIDRESVVPVEFKVDLRPVRRPTLHRMDVRQRRASDGVVVGGARVVLLQLPRNVLDEVRDVPVLR